MSGTIRDVSGKCPNVTLTVDGTSVVAGDTTHFDGGKCTQLKSGVAVTASGVLGAGGALNATSIQITKPAG